MKSKKSIWITRVGIKTFKNHKVPRQLVKELKKNNFNSSVKIISKVNNKRARKLNYFLILGFEE